MDGMKRHDDLDLHKGVTHSRKNLHAVLKLSAATCLTLFAAVMHHVLRLDAPTSLGLLQGLHEDWLDAGSTGHDPSNFDPFTAGEMRSVLIIMHGCFADKNV